MSVTLAQIVALARFSIADPQAGARRVLAMNLPMVARWWLIALVAVVSALLTHISLSLLPEDVQAMIGPSMLSPLRSAVVQGGVLLLAVLAIYRIGRARGGTGSFADALLLIGWLQTILLGVQAAQVVAQLLLPPLADGISLVGVALFLWLLTNFVAELHGFQSRGSVFFGIFATIFAAALGIAIVIASLAPTGA